MLNEIKQRGIVGKDGKIKLPTSDLTALVKPLELDEATYLLSTRAKR